MSFSKNVFKSFGKFKIPEDTKITFISPGLDISALSDSEGVSFFSDLEKFNLKLVPEGTSLGFVQGSINQVQVHSEFEEDLFSELFYLDDGKLIVKTAFYAAMVTKDVEVPSLTAFLFFKKT